MKLLVMSPDGDYQLESPSMSTVDEVMDYANDMGSKWFFYPHLFVVTDSGKTIIEPPVEFSHLIGKRVSTAVRFFQEFVAVKKEFVA